MQKGQQLEWSAGVGDGTSRSDRVKSLGALEQRVMEVLWRRAPLSVRETQGELESQTALAYTTVMTTLDRLHKKKLLVREKDGAAFLYRPALGREAYLRALAEAAAAELLSEAASPVLAAFVDAAARVDAAHLDELERLIAARRSALKGERDDRDR